MKTTRWIVIAAVLAGIVYLLAPVYVFLAEDNPALVPFGWTAMPEDAPYTEGEVAATWRTQARDARALLLSHREVIGAPALSAAVAKSGRIVWSGAVGWADVEARLAATPDTLFRIGSTSKAVTGTVTARLVDAGLVSLDAPISRWFEDPPNPAWRSLTLRQLASHTAGIPGYENNSDWIGVYRALWPRSPRTTATAGLDFFDGAELIYEPGTAFFYSSYDVGLQAAVLEQAAGATYPELLARDIREPLGLDSPLPDGEHPDGATFYMQRDDGRVARVFSYDVSHRMAGGGLMARPRDIALMGQAWLRDEFIEGETRRAFWTAQTLADGTMNPQRYALNWRVRDDVSTALLGFNANHGGVGKGAMSWLIVVPAEDLALSMMINTRVLPFARWIEIQDELIALFSNDPGL